MARGRFDYGQVGYSNPFASMQSSLADMQNRGLEERKLEAEQEQRALANKRADAQLKMQQTQEADRVKDRDLLDTQRANNKLANRFLAMEGTTSLPYTDIYNMAASKDPSLNKKFDLDELTQNILDTHYGVLSKGQEAVKATPAELKAALAAEAVQDSEYAKLDAETTAWGNRLENQDRISQAREAVRMFPDSPVAIKNLQDQLAARDSSQVTSAQNKQALAIKMAELGSKNTTSTDKLDQVSKLAFTTAQSNLKDVAALSSDVAGNLKGKQKQDAMDFIDKEISKNTPAAVIKAKMAAGMGMTNNWVFDDTTTFDVSKANKALGDTYKGTVDYSAGMPGTVGNTSNTNALNALQSQLDMLNRTPEEIKAARDSASADSLLNRFGLAPVTPPIVTPPKTGDNTKTGKDGKTPIVEVTGNDKNIPKILQSTSSDNTSSIAHFTEKDIPTIRKSLQGMSEKARNSYFDTLSDSDLKTVLRISRDTTDGGFLGNAWDQFAEGADRLTDRAYMMGDFALSGISGAYDTIAGSPLSGTTDKTLQENVANRLSNKTISKNKKWSNLDTFTDSISAYADQRFSPKLPTSGTPRNTITKKPLTSSTYVDRRGRRTGFKNSKTTSDNTVSDPFFSSGKRPLPRKEELAAARSIMIDNNPDTTKEQKARSRKMNNFVNNIPSDNPSFIEDLFDNLTNIEAPFTNKLTGKEATSIRDGILNKLSKSSTKFLSEDDILRITSSPDFQKLGDAYKKPILDRIAKRKKVQ